MTIGERIKKLRIEKNMSQSRLGIELSVSQEAISSYETDKTVPIIEVFIMMAELFDVSVDYILGIDKERKRISEAGLDSFESALISNFRKLSERDKELFIRYIVVTNEYVERRLKN